MKSLFHTIRKTHPFVLGVTLTSFVFTGLFVYAYMQIFDLNDKVALLNEELERKTTELATTAGELASGLTTLDEKASSISTTLTGAQQEIKSTKQNLDQKVNQVANTVGTLEKLSKTDPELLQKYSKVFFLNEHYTPERVTEIPNAYKYYEQRNYVVHEQVWPYLQKMIDAANKSGKELYVYSAYRSFDEQSALKGAYKVTYGEGTANQFSADQGYSEHQLGTTADLITTGIGGTLDGFDGTDEYQWLLNNAYKYGFILSYPQNNSYYTFEPWHWRFVGVKLATYLHDNNQQFYNLDQRKIDEYLVSVFD